MKRLLNTLYVTTPGSWLAKERETVVVSVDRETKGQFPLLSLGSVVCFGHVSASPQLIGACAERGVSVAFLTENGRFLYRAEGPARGNVLLRREQYRRSESRERSAEMAGAITAAKIANSRASLLRTARDHESEGRSDRLRSSAAELGRLLSLVANEGDLEKIRGLEGLAARVYFDVFDDLVLNQKEGFFFRERSRRPPQDNLNALLSFVYTLLVHDVRSALEVVGLDPAVGFLHRDRPGRPSLALDLMEELRPIFADRLVLSLVNLLQVNERGFRTTETGGVEMDEATRKTVIVAYQKRKQDELEHPFLGERTTLGLVPHLQALLLARILRGDLDGYPPFFWK
jgi:CRISPR-associated protein Cas1